MGFPVGGECEGGSTLVTEDGPVGRPERTPAAQMFVGGWRGGGGVNTESGPPFPCPPHQCSELRDLLWLPLDWFPEVPSSVGAIVALTGIRRNCYLSWIYSDLGSGGVRVKEEVIFQIVCLPVLIYTV